MSVVTYLNPRTGETLMAEVGPAINDSRITQALIFVDRTGMWIMDSHNHNYLNPYYEGRKAVKHFITQIKASNLENSGEIIDAFLLISQLNWKKVPTQPSETTEDINIFTDIPEWAVRAIRPYIGYEIVSDDGTYSLITRVASSDLTYDENMSRHVWIRTTNPLTALQASEFAYEDAEGNRRKLSLLYQLDRDLIEARAGNPSRTWGVIETKDGTGSRTLTFTQIWNKMKLEALIPQHTRLRHNLENFTNDPRINAYQYFPLEDLPEPDAQKCPAWQGFESQMPDWGKSLWRAVCYGIYDADNRSKQILILQDSGHTGKSPVFNCLAQMGGKGFACSINQHTMDSQFWGSAVFGKRLALIPDTNNSRWLMTSKIKQLSGGDTINVEFKGQTPFAWKPNIRFLISCNGILEIDLSQRHQLDRILYIPLISGNWEYDPTYEDRLKDEFWNYIAVCKTSYDALCVNHGNIIQPPEMLEILNSTCTFGPAMDIQSLETCLIQNPEGTISDRCLRALVDYLDIKDRDSRHQLESIRENMKLRWCVTELGTMNTESSRPDRFYKGVSLKPTITYSDLTGMICTTLKPKQSDKKQNVDKEEEEL